MKKSEPQPSEWTCGHVAGAVCAECYRLLAVRANNLAAENRNLIEEVAELRRQAIHEER